MRISALRSFRAMRRTRGLFNKSPRSHTPALSCKEEMRDFVTFAALEDEWSAGPAGVVDMQDRRRERGRHRVLRHARVLLKCVCQQLIKLYLRTASRASGHECNTL